MTQINAIDKKAFGKVAVLMGGPYAEREVSLMSGKAVLKALQTSDIQAVAIDVDDHICHRLLEEKPDRVFIAMHGTYGEDGTVQGLLESLRIPYTGSDVLSSAIAMDKHKTKLIWKALGLPTLDFHIADETTDFFELKEKFKTPLAVKPTSEGSSVGVTKVNTKQEFTTALAKAQQHKNKVMIEPWIEGQELTVCILGDKTLPVIRIATPVGFYDYEAKYFSEETQFFIPSGLKDEREAELKTLAFKAYQALGCRHFGRVDLIMDKHEKFWLLEANTIPGLTSHSLVPQAAAAVGMSFADLTLEILRQTL